MFSGAIINYILDMVAIKKNRACVLCVLMCYLVCVCEGYILIHLL